MRTFAPFAQSGLLVRLLALALLIIVGLLFMGIFMISLPGMREQVNGSYSIQSLKALQFAQTLFIFIFPALILAWLINTKPFKYMGMKTMPSLKVTFLVIASLVVAMPFMNLLIALNEAITFPEWLSGLETWFRESEDQAQRTTELMLTSDNGWQLLFNFFLIAGMAGLSEEMFFRGILQNLFNDQWKRNILAIWLAAFIFSAVHMQFYGFFPRLILGAYFGYLFYWSRSLWLPIFAHMTNNAFAIVEYTFKRDYDENQMTIFGEIDEPMTYVMAAGSAFFFYLIVRYLYKFAGKKHESKAENPKTDTAINNEPS